ncbi:MAG TPA: NIPSNAP family protein [Devosia sp.]|nr:NIPSNAP family protein [Devosia sp.]
MTFQWIASDVETPIVELRRYSFQPGRRDDFIELFETRFIEAQEAVGARIPGMFSIEGAPDSLIWLRAFAHQDARRPALEQFYGGPTWQFHRDAANATLADNDDVHLLRAIAPAGGIALSRRRPSPGEAVPARPYRLLISELRYPEALGDYHLWLRLFLRKAGCDLLASFGTLAAENTYPRLVVWENRPVHVALLAGEGGAVPPLPPELRNALRTEPELLVLHPTARSHLR